MSGGTGYPAPHRQRSDKPQKHECTATNMIALLVEDNTSLAELVIEFLEDSGIECDHTFSGLNAIELTKTNSYDVIVLDINLPGCDGLEVCKTLRNDGNNTPCIMLTARDSLDDKLTGFNVGADDYLIKPFAMAELVARIQALTQRNQHTKIIRIEDLSVNIANHSERVVHRGSTQIQLSPDEWRTLIALAKNSPNVVSRTVLEDLLWPDGAPSMDALKMVIYRLRKCIDIPGCTPLVHTIRGVGIALHAKA